MGITSFWPTFFEEGEDEKIVNLFELASNHVRDTGRPYRIAVDTPYWMFKNLSEEKAQAIRATSQRASNPNDKAILYRMMRFAIHGIQVVLVFDGNRKPHKRGKKGCAEASKIRPLLKETAEKLGIPWWQAPAEAEAECARMQQLGIVDAVFSEDSDTFMFKGETLIRFHLEENHKKSNTHVLIYRMSDIKHKLPGTEWKNLVLFAAVVGGDYAMKGLPGCGPKVALDAARHGFGVSLVDAFNNKRLNEWRQDIGEFLERRGTSITIPRDYPNVNALKECIEPRVSDEQKLRSGITWEAPVDQRALRILITTRFNFSVQEYIQWVCRMLLVRRLLSGWRGVDADGLELVDRQLLKESGYIAMSKVSYILTKITDRHLLETWPEKVTIQASRKKPYIYEERVECGIPDNIIKLALPQFLERQPIMSRRSRVATSERATSPKGAKEPGTKRKPDRPRKDATNGIEKVIPQEGAQAPGQKRRPSRPSKDGGPNIDSHHPTKKPKTGHNNSLETSTSQQVPGPFFEESASEDFPGLSDTGSKVFKTASKATKKADLVDLCSSDYLDGLDDDALNDLFESRVCSPLPGITQDAPKGQQTVPQRRPLSVLGLDASGMTATQREHGRADVATGQTRSQGIDLTED
ncbi:hypothetical protein VSDG_00129 [Cytospora chrysosperma]|uniref:XPG-I domain-containing protein n=1 Tax=Cytospora chrysosperma TaxID=252740 RepID=A0A423WQE3_CYTCH|nr:hypothetical protein VSDG_00129 [Valsa sordida]